MKERVIFFVMPLERRSWIWTGPWKGDRSRNHQDQEWFRIKQRQSHRNAYQQGFRCWPLHPQLCQRKIRQEEV